MSALRRGSTEPAPRVERVTELAEVLEQLPELEAKVFLAHALYGADNALIGSRFWPRTPGDAGAGVVRAHALYKQACEALRQPAVKESLSDFVNRDGTIRIDERLRTLIRRWRLEELFAPVCPVCQHVYVPRSAGLGRGPGRYQEYCSAACKQKAYRERRRQ